MLLSGLFKATLKSDKQTSQSRMDLFVSAFENNYTMILSYLPHAEQARAKLSTSLLMQSAEEFTISALLIRYGLDSGSRSSTRKWKISMI